MPVVSGTFTASNGLLISEDFDSSPLTSPWYDDGIAFDKGTMPETGSDCWRYSWTEGDIGTNGLITARCAIPNQSEVTIEFDFAASANFADQRPGSSYSAHFMYVHTNLDGLYGDNTTIYLEPDGDGNFWVDINKSDEPATWQEVRNTADVDVYDGEVHTVSWYMKANTFGNADGEIKLVVDGITTIDRTDIEIFIYEGQFFDKVELGPYIIGPNSASGPLSYYVDNLRIYGGTHDVPAATNGIISFSASSSSIDEDEGTAVVSIIRSSGSDGAVTVDVDSSDITATAGEDYTAVDQTVEFADGETNKSVTVTISDDMSSESNETLLLTLSNATGGATVGTPQYHTLTIVDQTPGTGGLEVDFPVYAWDQDTIDFTVYNPGASTVTFDYATADLGSGTGYAEAGTDYTATSGTDETIAAGEKKTYSVPINYSSAPAGGSDAIRFTVTDSDENVTHGRGLIQDVLQQANFDEVWSEGSPTRRKGRVRSHTQSSFSNYLHGIKSGAVWDTTTAAVGKTSIKHDCVDYDNREFDSGLDSLSASTICKIGTMDDGEEYYFKLWIKFEEDFDWYTGYPEDGKAQNKFKFGRISKDYPGAYTTWYLKPDRFQFGRSWPTAADSFLYLYYDFDPVTNPTVREWTEVIFYQKRESAWAAHDGIARLYINGVLEDEVLNTDYMNNNGSNPGTGLELHDSRCCLGGWTQQQIGSDAANANGGDEVKGGYVWTCGHITSQYWPSAKYDKPE